MPDTEHGCFITGRMDYDPTPQSTSTRPATLTLVVANKRTGNDQLYKCLFWGDLATSCLELQRGDVVQVEVNYPKPDNYKGRDNAIVGFYIEAYRLVIDGQPAGEWVRGKREEKRESKDDSTDTSFL